MKISKSLCLYFLLSLAYCSGEENSVLREQCGGTITSDSSSLIFPGNGESIRPGEVCVWTILLETTRDFRMNFRHFDTNSTNCNEGGMRIYSLNNLVSSDNIESYEFCASSPAPEDFFLSGTAAAVVIYGSANNSDQGWFGLSWTGNSFDPLKTTHVSSFSTVSSGAIRYPIVGEYEPNLVATWNVDASPSLHGIPIEFSLESIKLDDCTNTDPCTCDALILYEISASGHLKESRRFCNDATNIILEGIQNKFILTFFSDGQAENSTDSGFQAVYFPKEEPTTTLATTTTETSPGGDTPCGSIIRGSSGVISYKNGTAHGLNERCVWIIEVQDSDMVIFELEYGNYYNSHPANGVQVAAFRRDGNMLRTEKQLFLQPGTNVVLQTEVAVVTFFSRGTNIGEGFTLSFQRIISQPNRFIGNHKIISDTPSATLNYPETGVYSDNELSFFLYAPGFKGYESDFDTVLGNITINGLDDVCDCCDFIEVYSYDWVDGWEPTSVICYSEFNSNYRFYHDDPLLFILISNSNGHTGRGITMEFRAPDPTHL